MTRKQQMRKIVREYRESNGLAFLVVKSALGADAGSWPEWLNDLWNEIIVADMYIREPCQGGRNPMLLLADVLCSELGECP